MPAAHARPSVTFAVMIMLNALLVAVGCSRLADHPLVREAVEEVRINERVAELLGGPVSCERAVRGTANETDGIAKLEFTARGPAGSGLVVVEGKKTRGEWGVTHLELRPAAGDKLSLTADLEAHTGTDTPAFDPTAAPTTPAAPPPGDIEIVLPPGPPGQ
jgi:hypothetical protein